MPPPECNRAENTDTTSLPVTQKRVKMKPTIDILPYELIRDITSYLRDSHHHILNCILVSRLWSNVALPNLYYKYTINGKNTSQLQQDLQRASRFGHWIRILCIHEFFSNDSKYTHIPDHAQASINLRNLRAIEFHWCRITRPRGGESIPFQLLVRALCPAPTVQTVEFIRCAISAPAIFSIIGTFPNVSNVLLWGSTIDMGDVEGSKPHAFTHDYPPRISSMGILYPIYAENLFETFVHPLLDRFTHGLRTLHLDITGLCGRGWWEKLQPTLSSLGPTLQELTLRLAVKLGAFEKKWLKSQVLSHIDLCVLPNLTTFHLSTLWHEDASLHLLQSLACPHLRMITLDATFDSLDLFKPEDFGKHDDVLVRFSQDHPVQVMVKYFGGLTTQKFQSHIASAFPKVNERGLLRIVKVSSELDLEMGPFFEEFLPMELDFCL